MPDAAVRHGDEPAFVAAHGAWSLDFASLHRVSDEAAVGLAAAGVREGAVVALVLPSVIDYVVAYAAIAKLGAVTAGVNPRLTESERAAVLAKTAPDMIISTRELRPGRAASATTIEVTPASSPAEVLSALRVEGRRPDALPHDDGRPVAIVFTSGTTGAPKGALFCGRHLRAVARSDVGDAIAGGGPMIATTQFAHVGFMTKLPWQLRIGATMHLLERWQAGPALRIVAEQRMTTVGGVAPQIALMLRAPEMDELDLSCVQQIVAGAGPSPPALVAGAKARFGAGYSIRYSSTESGGIGTATAPDADDAEALYTIGRPRPGVEVEIRDDRGAPVPDGEVGELVLRSPCVMQEYWRDPDATAAVLADGWLRTGDLAVREINGCLRLMGRTKEMFIRGGYNVYPLEVEAVLGTHPAVADVVVVPRPDPVMGEVGTAVVIVARGAPPPSLDELRAHAADRLAAWKLPEAIRFVDELPLNAMGKIDRRRLAAEER